MSQVDSIPIDAGQMSGLDELTGAPALCLNAIVSGAAGTGTRAVRARPGIRAWTGFPSTATSTSPVVAMDILGGRLIYVTDDGAGTRKVFGLAAADTCIDMSFAAGDSLIGGFDAVSLVSWRDFAVACGGATPQKISRGFISTRLSGLPPQSADICVIAQRLVIVAPDEYGLFFWNSLPGEAELETWDQSLDFAEAEARPDRLLGCKATSRELWLFGENTTQIFAPDADLIFAPAVTLEHGCLNKRSAVRIDQSMGWLNDRAQAVVSDGRELAVISDRGMTATFRRLAVPSDCWAFRCSIGGHDIWAQVFPTEGITLAWDTLSETWSEWRRRDPSSGRWLPWAPTSYLYIPPTAIAAGIHLVGMPDGTIAELTLDAHTDMGDPIAWTIRTGFREMAKQRHAVEVRFPCRRGEGESGAATVSVSWRDDLGAFTPPEVCSLGEPGDYEADVVVSPVGMPFRRRQYEISGSADAAYTVLPGKETYEESEF